MMLASPYFVALYCIAGFAVISWLFSVVKKDVSFVDSLWSLFFVVVAAVLAFSSAELSLRAQLVLVLVVLWSLRLSVYITVRNWGEPEDYRYQTIRANNEPGFTFKSLYIVFGLQGLLAWIVALPLLPAIKSSIALGPLDMLAAALWGVGFLFEAVGDYQLARFKRDTANKGRVLDSGLWRFTRHPNYFGEFCIWWAFYLFAVAAGGWWTIFAPLLISVLLLKVSGVAMLEKTISERRPKYVEYMQQTNAFFPGPRRTAVIAKETQA